MKKLSSETVDIIRKVHELAAYREDYIRTKGLPLSFKHTCIKMRISLNTVRRFAPELYEKWEDINFHWEISDR